MSNSDVPAGSPGGPTTVPTQNAELPDKMRVHALAKLLGRSSREIIAALGGLGVEIKSAQSSIDRKVAEQVVTALVTDIPATATPGATPDSAAATAAAPEAAVPEAAAPEAPAPEAPVEAAPAEPESSLEAPAAKAPAGLAPVFAPPAPLFQAPTRPTRTRRRAAEPAEDAPAGEASDDTQADDAAPSPRRTRSRSRSAAPETAEETPEEVEDTTGDAAEDTSSEADDTDESDEDGAARRRRRRGRRGRGRGRGGDDEGTEENGTGENGDESADDTDGATSEGDSEEASEDEGDDENDQADGEAGSSRRRRRRRRRRGSGEDAEAGDDDPPGTITRVRQPRDRRGSSDSRDDGADDGGDGVQSVRGSTRLEAKRQRRRDGRDAGRRRVPILSEAEFLARREAVERTMVVRERGDRMEVAVLEDEVLVEHFVAGRDGGSMVGNIYLGRVQNVLPSMEAAFVDIGRGRNAVLYAGEVDWDAAGLGGKARRIEQALSSGDSVLVQVTKDPIGHKGARLTTQISLAGRFLVYVPSGGAAGISRKLPDVERKRLKDMLKEIVPSEAGVIIRTASEGVSHEALERDVRRLQAQWEVVKEKAEKTGPSKPKAPTLLYEEPDLLVKVVRDQFNEDFSRLVVQGDDAWDTLHNYLGHVAPELADRIHRHVGSADVFTEHRIDEQLLKALDRKVWLPSGGTLVIDRTEAMTVVDVNTGKYTGSGGNLEETVTRNNLEAAEEIVRQLRLRDIGGIIVIDFIDMVLEANRDLVLRRLTECLARDRTRHQVAEVTSLGLVQMTRKRVGGGLLEHFSTPCEHCRGRGVIVTAEPVEEKQDTAHRPSPPEGARRSRGGRGGRTERNGHDAPQHDEPGGSSNGAVPNGRGRGDRRDNGQETGPDTTPDTAAASIDVGAPAAVAVADAPAPVTPAPAAVEAVEEVVVERSVVAEVERTLEETAPVEPAGGRPARRRGRVTRTAGAPVAADGDAPTVAVVTVPATKPAEPEPVVTPAAVVAAPPQPDPSAVTSRPRRARRAASRPAGPPVAEPGADPV
jgi:ribonuclease E